MQTFGHSEKESQSGLWYVTGAELLRKTNRKKKAKKLEARAKAIRAKQA